MPNISKVKAKEIGILKKAYVTKKIDLAKLLLSEVFLILIPTIVITVSLYKGGDVGFLYAGLILAVLIIFIIYDRYRKGRIIELTIYDNGVKTDKGTQYFWDEIRSIEPRKHEEGIYSGFLPGFWIHFKDGKKQLITQELIDYHELYQEFCRRNVSGSRQPLPLYELSDTGTAKGKWSKPIAFYDPITCQVKEVKKKK